MMREKPRIRTDRVIQGRVRIRTTEATLLESLRRLASMYPETASFPVGTWGRILGNRHVRRIRLANGAVVAFVVRRPATVTEVILATAVLFGGRERGTGSTRGAKIRLLGGWVL